MMPGACLGYLIYQRDQGLANLKWKSEHIISLPYYSRDLKEGFRKHPQSNEFHKQWKNKSLRLSRRRSKVGG